MAIWSSTVFLAPTGLGELQSATGPSRLYWVAWRGLGGLNHGGAQPALGLKSISSSTQGWSFLPTVGLEDASPLGLGVGHSANGPRLSANLLLSRANGFPSPPQYSFPTRDGRFAPRGPPQFCGREGCGGAGSSVATDIMVWFRGNIGLF